MMHAEPGEERIQGGPQSNESLESLEKLRGKNQRRPWKERIQGEPREERIHEESVED
jgi:hypothetical protein